MYLHIGQDWMISYTEIIGIFQRTLLDRSLDFRLMVDQLRHQGRVFGDWDEAKTLVLTDDRIFLTSISCHTLVRRQERWELLFE